MDVSTRVAAATTFVWLGMVLAISFVEAPLKFRAPGVTLRIGLGIGRLIFRALNTLELLFAVVICAVLFTHHTPDRLNIAITVAVGMLLLQLVVVRPLLSRRTTEVLEGDETERSRAHFAYVALELVKVVSLVVAGIAILGM
ncbi:hypothetical protein [Mycobacterium sp. RTGN3]|uniref:hypothetical protein n=1 Tax=unclassified Mycobacterium TaxID=2642494 RepID=UPI0039AFA695